VDDEGLIEPQRHRDHRAECARSCPEVGIGAKSAFRQWPRGSAALPGRRTLHRQERSRSWGGNGRSLTAHDRGRDASNRNSRRARAATATGETPVQQGQTCERIAHRRFFAAMVPADLVNSVPCLSASKTNDTCGGRWHWRGAAWERPVRILPWARCWPKVDAFFARDGIVAPVGRMRRCLR